MSSIRKGRYQLVLIIRTYRDRPNSVAEPSETHTPNIDPAPAPSTGDPGPSHDLDAGSQAAVGHRTVTGLHLAHAPVTKAPQECDRGDERSDTA
jgi:hypothetical protein